MALCGKKRDELLVIRVRLATLHALAGDWEAARPHLGGDGSLGELRELHASSGQACDALVAHQLPRRGQHAPVAERRRERWALNRRWLGALAKVDLSGVNELREAYNRCTSSKGTHCARRALADGVPPCRRRPRPTCSPNCRRWRWCGRRTEARGPPLVLLLPLQDD